jgi:putative Holliday junction resolvase
VRIGFAVSDELGLLAHPRPFVHGADIGRAIGRFSQVAREVEISHFIVGLPRELNGREGPAARRARQFASKLEEQSGCQVTLLDERFSTVEARGRLRQQGLKEREIRERVDSAAAALLLQSWLDKEGANRT